MYSLPVEEGIRLQRISVMVIFLFQKLLQALSLFLEESYCQHSGKQTQACEVVLKYGVRKGKGRTGIAFHCESAQKFTKFWSLINRNPYCKSDMSQYWDPHSMSSLTEPHSWVSKQE